MCECVWERGELKSNYKVKMCEGVWESGETKSKYLAKML